MSISSQTLFNITFEFSKGRTQLFCALAKNRKTAYKKVVDIIGQQNLETPKRLVSIKTICDINHA